MPFISKVAVGKLEKLKVFGNDYNTHDGTGKKKKKKRKRKRTQKGFYYFMVNFCWHR